MDGSAIAIGIGLAIPGLLFVLIRWSQKRDNKRIAATNVPGLGTVSEYRNRIECVADGPWGSCAITSFDKVDMPTFVGKVTAFRGRYDRIKLELDRAVQEAASCVGTTVDHWAISSINVDGGQSDYSLIVDTPNCGAIAWGIGIDVREDKVLEWELLH